MVQLTIKALDPELLKNVHINKKNVETQVNKILQSNQVWTPENLFPWLLRAVSVIDLTTLSGFDTKSNVTRLCVKAANPLPENILQKYPITTAAVCVYPSRVSDAQDVIMRMGMSDKINIASVATGFPAGLYPLESRLSEIKHAIVNGATEIDVVLDRSLVLSGKWNELFEEVLAMRKACGQTHLKVILGVGELGTYTNVYKASMVSMLAGADFIKTSTGKEAVNATLPVGLVMCRAIRDFYLLTGNKVGLKPAGGIQTAADAVNWLILVNNELGQEWLQPKLFRIGASSLLDALVQKIEEIEELIPQLIDA